MPYVIGGVFSFGIMVNLITDVFRHLFFFLDGIIYGLIPIVFNLIHTLYDFSSLLNEEALINIFKNVSATIYSFLAIFMFFRVAFSLISMLVDPSIIDDKEKGAKNIIKNIMICLILIVVVPYGFSMAKNIQAKVIDEHLIEKVVAGEKFDDNYNLGDELSRTILGVFMYPTTEGDHAADVYKSVFDAKNEKLAAMNSVLSDVTGNPIVNLLNLNLFSDKTHYSIGYLFGLSTFVGGYVLFVIIGLMIDIGYRAIKFVALELISPIAIVSYIDPSSGKKGVFSKWLNETIKTYLSLFIRIFAFSFVSVLLSTLNFSQLNGEAGLFTKIFYILAIIAFIKSAPKFIDNLFGTSISKDGDTKFASDMFKGVLGAGVVGATGLASSAVMTRGMSGANRAKAMLGSTWNGMKKGYGSAKKGGFIGVVGSSFDAYNGVKKDTNTMSWFQKQENIENAKLSDRIEDAKDFDINPLYADPIHGKDYARFLKRDANGNLVKDAKGKVQTDKDAMNAWLQSNGYNYIDASDPNVVYHLEKYDKNQGKFEQLKKEGYSNDGIEIRKELAIEEQKLGLIGIEYDNVTGKIEQNAAVLSNISFDTARTRGYKVDTNGVYASVESAKEAYKNSLVQKYNAVTTTEEEKLEIKTQINNIANVSIETVEGAGFKVATENDRVFANENEAIIAVNNAIEKEIDVLTAKQLELKQKKNKTTEVVGKKKAKLSAHEKENQKDSKITKRLLEGDRYRGREKE